MSTAWLPPSGGRTVLLAACLLTVTACDGNSPNGPTPVDGQVVLAPGQTAEFSAGLSVRFVSVVGDSRCPIDAMCVWAGDAVVRIHVASGVGRADRDLHTEDMQPVTFDDVEVRLVELTPYPFSGHTTELRDYRATLRVIRQ
jgi:hypothetical protein